MSRRIAKKKTLFSVPIESGEAPALRGGRCTCGHVFFPPQQMGCDVCGASGDAIDIIDLTAAGILQTFATAHRQKRPGGNSSLVVGAVVLDDGPVVEVVLDVEDERGLRAGQRVGGRLVEVGEDDDGRPVVDCFFAPLGAT